MVLREFAGAGAGSGADGRPANLSDDPLARGARRWGLGGSGSVELDARVTWWERWVRTWTWSRLAEWPVRRVLDTDFSIRGIQAPLTFTRGAS